MGDRAVYCARLESVCAFIGTGSSNLPPSVGTVNVKRKEGAILAKYSSLVRPVDSFRWLPQPVFRNGHARFLWELFGPPRFL